MRDRHEGLVGVLDEGRDTFNLADAVQEPVKIDIQQIGERCELLAAGMCRATAQDVIDKGAVDAGFLGEMRRWDVQLPGPRTQAIGESMMRGHDAPNGMWICVGRNRIARRLSSG